MCYKLKDPKLLLDVPTSKLIFLSNYIYLSNFHTKILLNITKPRSKKFVLLCLLLNVIEKMATISQAMQSLLDSPAMAVSPGLEHIFVHPPSEKTGYYVD